MLEFGVLGSVNSRVGNAEESNMHATGNTASCDKTTAAAGESSVKREVRKGWRSVGLRLVAGLGVAVGCLLPARSARADLELGADLGGAYSLDGDNSAGGGSFGLRLGNRLSLPMLMLAAELRGGLDTYGGDRSTDVYTGMGGLRLGVGEVLRPSVFVHAGVGHVVREATLLLPEAKQTGFALDAGAALDLTLLPLIDLGVHAAYGVIDAAGFDWIRAGVHATLVL